MAAEQALHYAADFQHAGDRISIRRSIQCQMVISLHKYLDKAGWAVAVSFCQVLPTPGDRFNGNDATTGVWFKFLNDARGVHASANPSLQTPSRNLKHTPR
jgi:hypothetical protein